MPNNDLQKLTHSALIDLYEIDLNPISYNIIQRFTNESNPDGTNLIWRGNSYIKYPMESSGFEKSKDSIPGNPEIRLSNLGSVVTALVKAYKGLTGAQIRRYTIFSHNLDGMPGANSLEVQDYQVWSISRNNRNDLIASFSLKHSLELTGARIPRRRIGVL
jgi:lambda family phage minor tail protein L